MTPSRATAGMERRIFLIATEEVRRSPRRQFDEGAAPAPWRRGAVRRHRRPRDGARGPGVAVSDRRALDHRARRRRQGPAEDPRADQGNRHCGDGSGAGCSCDHRQPGLHPSRRQTRSRQGFQDSDRQLCLAFGVGVAARPGARDAEICRSCAGAAAVRARGLSQAARAALQLCRPSPDRAVVIAAPERRGSRAAGGIAAGAAGAAGKPAQRNPPPHGSVRPGGGAAAGAGRDVRTGAADHAASAGSGRGCGEDLAGAAPGRDRRAGEARPSSGSRTRRWPNPAR